VSDTPPRTARDSSIAVTVVQSDFNRAARCGYHQPARE